MNNWCGAPSHVVLKLEKFCLILLKTKCKSTGSLMSIPFKTPVFLFPTLFFFCILIFFVTKIIFLRNRLMILFINWYKTSSSLEKSEPHRFSLKKCEFIRMFNSLSYSWLIHVEYSSIIHEEKKKKLRQSHLGTPDTKISSQFCAIHKPLSSNMPSITCIRLDTTQ